MDKEPYPPVLIDTLEKLDEALHYWKNTTFSQHYLKLDDVVESLQKPRGHLVDARQEFAARWVLSPPGGKKRATLWTAAVWRWNSDLETGNFVPAGEAAPARLPESRIQTIPNNMCRFSYVMDTTHDKSLWQAQKVFESHVQKITKFNPGKKGRREFQNGVLYTSTFHLSSQIFVKRTAYTRTKEASRTYPLHDWIKNATKKGMPFFANDERPVLFEPDEAGGLRPLSECYPPALKVGDLVWMSFSVEFFIGNMHWSTNFIPYEFVRVGSVALELLPEIKKEFDEGEEEEGPRERLGVGMRGISAASARELNAAGDTLPVVRAEELAELATQPNIDVTSVEAPAPNNPDRPHNFLPDNVGRPRSPRAFIDSESEERTETATENSTDEDNIDSGTQPDDDDDDDDDESMLQSEYMSVDDNSFIVDDSSSLTDVDASFTDDAKSFVDDTTSPGCDDGSAAEDSTLAADDDAVVVALVRPPTSRGKLLKQQQVVVVGRPDLVNHLADSSKASPKQNGKKRTASPVSVRRSKRVAKGKGIDN